MENKLSTHVKTTLEDVRNAILAASRAQKVTAEAVVACLFAVTGFERVNQVPERYYWDIIDALKDLQESALQGTLHFLGISKQRHWLQKMSIGGGRQRFISLAIEVAPKGEVVIILFDSHGGLA